MWSTEIRSDIRGLVIVHLELGIVIWKKKHSLWVWRSVSEGLHGEFAQRAENQKCIFLQDVRETGSIVGSL